MILEGRCAWAHVQKSTGSKTMTTKKGKTFVTKDEYRLDLFLDEDKARELKAKGYLIKGAKEDVPGMPGTKGKPYIKIAKRASYEDGNPVPAPGVFDKDGKAIHDLVGNGSLVQVQYNEYPYDNTFTGEQNISCRLAHVMVLEHVKYEGSAEGSAQVEFQFENKAKDTEFDDMESGW